MKFLTRNVFIKIIRFVTIVTALVVVLNSCTRLNTKNIEDYIGLYQIVDSDCDNIQDQFNPCENTLFFELLKGQFIGVEDSQLAYVFWSGDPKLDAELQYSAQLIADHPEKMISKNTFWLNNDDDSKEYLLFSKGELSGYKVIYNVNDKNNRRVIHYTLKSVQRGNLPNVRLNYPGNR